MLSYLFYFYSNQHFFLGKVAMFDSYTEKKEAMELAEWNKFISDFKIQMQKSL